MALHQSRFVFNVRTLAGDGESRQSVASPQNAGVGWGNCIFRIERNVKANRHFEQGYASLKAPYAPELRSKSSTFGCFSTYTR